MQEQLDRIEIQLAGLKTKVEETYQSAEKMRKYFLWTALVTLALIILPLLILPLFLPAFFASQGLDALQGF